MQGLEPEEALRYVMASGLREKRKTLGTRFQGGGTEEEGDGSDQKDEEASILVRWVSEGYDDFFRIGLGESSFFTASSYRSVSVLSQYVGGLKCGEEDGESESDGSDDEEEGEGQVDLQEEGEEIRHETSLPQTNSISDEKPNAPKFEWHRWLLDPVGRWRKRFCAKAFSESQSEEGHGSIFTSREDSGDEDNSHEEAGNWGWVRNHDQLMGEMSKGNIFCGFREGEIRFPPSFRWVRGAHGGDYDRVSTWCIISMPFKREPGGCLLAYCTRSCCWLMAFALNERSIPG